jgi:hypothetical protein
MRVIQIMVQMSKQVSNGNYGNEKVEGQWLAALEPGDDPIGCMQVLLDRGREQLLHHLSHSENRNVRLAVNPAPRLCETCRQPLADSEEYEHEGCREARMEQQRRESEERRRHRELAPAGVPDDHESRNDDDDEDPF